MGCAAGGSRFSRIVLCLHDALGRGIREADGLPPLVWQWRWYIVALPMKQVGLQLASRRRKPFLGFYPFCRKAESQAGRHAGAKSLAPVSFFL